MIAPEKVGTFAIIFSIVCAVLYTIATEINLPLVTYHPLIGDFDFLFQPPRAKDQPAMYWYGWMLTAFLGALIIAFLATMVSEKLLQRAIFCGVVGAAAYLVVNTTALSIYTSASTEMEFLKSRWTSMIAAAVIAVAAGYLTPARWNARLWSGWVWFIPIGSLMVLGYYLTPFFTR